MEKPVVIEEYNEEWSFKYQQEERKIKEVLGDKVIAIEYIGNTSVQGLGAKPIIDFMVGVNDIKEGEEFIEPLAKIGYEHVYHNEFPNRRFFRKGQWRIAYIQLWKRRVEKQYSIQGLFKNPSRCTKAIQSFENRTC